MKKKRKKKYRLKPRFFVIIAIFLAFVLSVSSCTINKISDKRDDKKSEKKVSQQVDVSRAELLKADGNNGLFILINKQNAVEDWYTPADLVPIESYYAIDRSAECRYMRSEAASAFLNLAADAEAAGLDIVMTTAYRSYDYQTTLWNQNVARYGSEEEANMISAKPGQSEHQSGLAVDISTESIGYKLLESFKDTPEGQWIAEHAHEYGFILRYLDGKSDITGYVYEPWHIRYVGKTAAAEIHDSGITLEEYLNQLEI